MGLKIHLNRCLFVCLFEQNVSCNQNTLHSGPYDKLLLLQLDFTLACLAWNFELRSLLTDLYLIGSHLNWLMSQFLRLKTEKKVFHKTKIGLTFLKTNHYQEMWSIKVPCQSELLFFKHRIIPFTDLGMTWIVYQCVLYKFNKKMTKTKIW